MKPYVLFLGSTMMEYALQLIHHIDFQRSFQVRAHIDASLEHLKALVATPPAIAVFDLHDPDMFPVNASEEMSVAYSDTLRSLWPDIRFVIFNAKAFEDTDRTVHLGPPSRISPLLLLAHLKEIH
jgi:DNA-binding NarL/FixJ family response regulator